MAYDWQCQVAFESPEGYMHFSVLPDETEQADKVKVHKWYDTDSGPIQWTPDRIETVIRQTDQAIQKCKSIVGS